MQSLGSRETLDDPVCLGFKRYLRTVLNSHKFSDLVCWSSDQLIPQFIQPCPPYKPPGRTYFGTAQPLALHTT